MRASEDQDEGDNWVTYGSSFSDDDTEQGRQRALYFGKHRPVPTAYEQRVLNEKGRPMRFHGAFTGGFSAGYFNTVGSKEGFKPRGFHSSRKDRTRETEERQMVQRPEDFMDEEDFGEFGIAPRRIRMAHNFDDTHVRDSMKAALGGQSIIPASSELLKNLIVPSKGPLAERLLRRMGWRDPTAALKIDEDEAEVGNSHSSAVRSENVVPSDEYRSASTPCLFATISFEAKTNTFGLGYSGLDPEVAMGRQLPRSYSAAPWDQLGDRHPEESSTALSRRQQAVQLQPGFNPNSGPSRSGIRGQAFGVGALETEDSDIYAQDKLTDYDWEIGGDIGGGPSSAEDEDEEDAEQAELEAARRGQLSSSGRKSLSRSGMKSTHQGSRTIDGWTAPSLSRGSTRSAPGSATGLLSGFVAASDSKERDQLMSLPPPIRLPPGYMPVFNPQCVRDPSSIPAQCPTDPAPNFQPGARVSGVKELARRGERLDALSRAKLLDNSSDSFLEMVSPVEQLRMQAAAAGLPVPTIKSDVDQKPAAGTVSAATDLTQSLKTDALLKPFKSDSGKQARFDAFQVLVRRGFTDEEAYTRCSGGVDLNGEERERELHAFQAILRTARQSADRKTLTDSDSRAITPVPGSRDTAAPLSTQLPLHKQQLVASLLASRFRSAGCMDISKELSESEEKAMRAKVESLETVEPRDHAVATESYGALTRRRLEWHPDRILCKRVNVPHPYPDSTFVGCPDERRPSNQPWRRKHHHRSDARGQSAEFSLFDLLDVNRGTEPDQAESTDSGDDSPASPGGNAELAAAPTPKPAPSTPAGASLFSVLFDAAASATATRGSDTPISKPGAQKLPSLENEENNSTLATDDSGTRRIGPSLPTPGAASFILDDQEETRPPMDLFKSIFASDEELSESDTEDDPSSVLSQRPSGMAPAESMVKPAAPTAPSSLFAHLFESTEDLDTPIPGLAPSFSQNNKTQDQMTKASPRDLNPDFVHGPTLPPTFDSNSQRQEVSDTTRSSTTTMRLEEPRDRLEWVVGTSDSATDAHRRHHHRHRHQSKHEKGAKRSKEKKKKKTSKRKHHKSEKRAHHSSRKSRSRPIPGESSSSSESSDSSD